MILPSQTIAATRVKCPETGALRQIVEPFVTRSIQSGASYGLSHAGYDIRIRQDLVLGSGDFRLASSIEHFVMPDDLLGLVKDKSTWARRGLSVYNTVIEPGWHGFLTLELVNHGHELLIFRRGDPIAQVIFQRLELPTATPYAGKYLGQEDAPVPAREEGDLAAGTPPSPPHHTPTPSQGRES